MSISSTTNRNDYVGNGAANTYAYGFKVFLSSELLVTVVNTLGVETTLVLNTDYSVTGVGSVSGGNVVLIDAGQSWITATFLTNLFGLTIRRVRALTQTADIRNQGDFYPETHEDVFDKQVMISQQQQDEIDRTLKLPETEAGTGAFVLPPVIDRASKFLGFDGSGNPIAAASFTGSAVASAYIETLLDDVDAATARATLGFAGVTAPVGTADLETSAVTTAKIADANVTVAKLASGIDSSSDLWNLGLLVSISANALVVALKNKSGADPTAASPVRVGFRSATATTGQYSTSLFTAAMSVTAAAADSLGVATGSAQILYVYLVENGGSSGLALSATLFDEGILQSASALTGGADTDPTVMWATALQSSRPVRLIGRIVATWSNPNWGSITDVSLAPFAGNLMTFTVTALAGSAPSGATGGGAGTNGTGTWVCPKGVTRALVSGKGGGGGGGGGSNLANAASGGGGGGSVSTAHVVSVVPGTSYLMTAGKGGAGGNGVNGTANDGSDGTASTFGSLLTFTGAHRGIGGGNRDQSLVSNFVWYGSGSGGHGGTGKTATTGPQTGSQSSLAEGGNSTAAFDGGGGGGGDSMGGTGGTGNSTSPGSPGNSGNAGGGGGGGGYSSGASAGGGGGAGGEGSITVTWIAK